MELKDSGDTPSTKGSVNDVQEAELFWGSVPFSSLWLLSDEIAFLFRSEQEGGGKGHFLPCPLLPTGENFPPGDIIADFRGVLIVTCSFYLC